MKSHKKSKFGNIWLRAVLVAVCCTVCSFVVFKFGIFDYLENKSYDKRMVTTAKSLTPSDEIVFIAIDQASIDWAQENKGWSWPWPREAYANIVEFLSAGGANSVMFDMLYTEPSFYGEDDDKAFADAQKNSGIVCQTVYSQDNGEPLFPIKPIKDSAALIANVTSSMDEDDVIRRYKPFAEIDGEVYPSLGMAPLVQEGEEFDFPTMAKDGTVKIRYLSGLNSYLPYPAGLILESYDAWKKGEPADLVPEDFAGTYAFFALYAPGLFDICSTPVSQVYPGVGVHITALDNYLQNNYIRDVPVLLVFVWFLVASLAGSFIVTFAEKRKSQPKIIISLVLGFIIGGFIMFAVPFLLFIPGINMPQVAPFISYVLSFLIMFVFIYVMEGKQKRFIKSAFSQCLSKDVVNDIIQNPESFTLGGKKMQMTAIFTDIEKFSSISELLTASQLGELLNYYLTIMSDIIINERGTVDKYEGDAIVAMVGAPVQMDDHAIKACRAALKMKKAEKLLNKEIRDSVAKGVAPGNVNEELFDAFKILVKNNKTVYTRIGINSGEMIAGYFGSTLKKNYTIMGNNVNLASRLEGVNKQYSTYGILISESTRNELGDEFIVRRLDRVQVVNIVTPIRLYELLEERQYADDKLINYVNFWEEAMTDFENGDYKSSLEKFKKLAAENKTDRVANYYVSLIENFFAKGKYPVDIGVVYNPELKVFRLVSK